MNAVAIVQARMGSTRLPGKALLPLGGTTVLGCVVDRLRAGKELHDIVIATSIDPSDDAVVREAQRLDVRISRGPLSDVLGRYAEAMHAVDADPVVRITADCPLIDGTLIDTMLASYRLQPCDYFSNTLERTFPRGLDTEIVAARALEVARTEADRPYEREHVTPFLYGHPERFALRSYVAADGSNRSDLRWTLDTPDDYRFLQCVYETVVHVRPRDVTTQSVLDALERDPALRGINATVRQKELGE